MKSPVRVGIIHAYPNTYLIESLQKAANCQIVLFVPQKPVFNISAIEAVIEVPLYNPSLVVKKVLDYHREKPFDALLPVYEGATAITAKSAEVLGLPGVKVKAAEASRNKYFSYSCWEKNGIPVPLTVPISEPQEGWKEIEAHLGYPVMVKLADSMNSQGVIKVTSRDDYQTAVERLLKMLARPIDSDLQTDRNRLAYGTEDIKIIAQEFCPGTEVGVDCLVANGKDHILGIFEKAPATGPYFAETMSVAPTSLNNNDVEKVSKIAADAVLALISEGISAAHVEIRFTEDGPKVLEAGLRPGGAYTVAAVEYLTGINSYGALLDVLLGNNIGTVKINSKAVLYGGITIPKSGVIQSARGLEVFDQVSGLLDVQVLNKIGDKVYALPESAQPHFAYYLIGSSSREEVLDKHHLIQNSIQLEISDFGQDC
ncbi:MAG: ATP-grasp domain-containing protein [Prochloron sp. SP5CPC1]|nr:ATP-grasp domain-containing protein [Candidatus Paraprochloron terpiosi SP5CPC1]